jgi:DNA-binding NarL/FixJ family response regulator
MNKKRIFIACADERLRIALVIFLEGEPGLTVVGFTDRLQSLLPQLEACQAEILLLEWQLDYPALKKTLDNVHKLPLPQKVVYFSGTPEDHQQILAAGADYVILKNAPPDELLPILNSINLQSTNV